MKFYRVQSKNRHDETLAFESQKCLAGADDMNELLQHVLDAHGGLELWSRFNFVQATIITGGELFAMKNEPQDPIPRRMTVATKKEWASVTPTRAIRLFGPCPTFVNKCYGGA
jgi:hypothetical protein